MSSQAPRARRKDTGKSQNQEQEEEWEGERERERERKREGEKGKGLYTHTHTHTHTHIAGSKFLIYASRVVVIVVEPAGSECVSSARTEKAERAGEPRNAQTQCRKKRRTKQRNGERERERETPPLKKKNPSKRLQHTPKGSRVADDSERVREATTLIDARPLISDGSPFVVSSLSSRMPQRPA